MHRVWVLAVALCAGCFSKPGFRGGGGDDVGGDGGTDAAVDAVTCVPTMAWPMPTAVTGLNNKVTGEPTITGDLEEVYFAYQNVTPWEIHYATLAPAGGGYDYQGKVLFSVVNGTDQDPSITDDGLLLVFREGVSDANTKLRQVTRMNRGDAWGPPEDVPGVTTVNSSTLDISGDGKTLYYNAQQTLRYATRMNRSDAFVEKPTQLGTNLEFPAISGDELTVYVSSGGIKSATRANKMTSFGTPSTLFGGTTMIEPDVTQDGMTMVVATRPANSLAISHRTCP